MLGGFLPGHWTPNSIVKFDPGLDKQAIDKVCQTPGVQENSCLRIAVEQTKLVGDPLQSEDGFRLTLESLHIRVHRDFTRGGV
ncbi:hypothetical protein CA54_59370 [Symmachiella macrocystis]|uniref:Uncharacterized protein n=1 Tax=Symmachiella macrocystis TaxID=2527985 RepID=A0A5C6B1A7_9PLAN|nr:hypothetical protein [Symmachiella macrocystis]TWU05249.1 hypothetical protein CA54_59370 [Symmachiella macrocystis]